MRHLLASRRGVSCLVYFAFLALAQHSLTHAQTITNISPTSGPAGTPITITGTGFGPTQGTGTVTFGGAPAASITSWIDTKIVVLPYDLKVPVNASLDVVVITAGNQQVKALQPFLETIPPLMPASGPAGTPVTIHGTGFGATKGAKSAITFNGQTVDLTKVTWSDTTLSVNAPDAGANMSVYLKIAVTDSSGTSQTISEFEETLAPAAAAGALALSPTSSAYGGTTLKITGTGFGATQGTKKVLFNGAEPPPGVITSWKDGEIDVTLPKFQVANDTPVQVSIQDGGKTTFGPAIFTESAPHAALTVKKGVPQDIVTITGPGFPDITQDKNAKVVFNNGVTATVQPKSSSDSTPNWSTSSITVAAPDLGAAFYGKPVTVRVADGTGNTVAQSVDTFTERREMWGDRDENPLDIRLIGGYEQGYLASQSSSNDAFLAIYGRKLFGEGSHRIGPFFAIRLLTAPQTGDNDNVTSVFTDPTGQIKTSDFSTVGSAVDFTGGLEWQLKSFARRRTTLSAIVGGGFVTPTNANTIGQSYQMPPFGTVECAELQSRLKVVLSGPDYKNIGENQYNYCFVNTAVSSTPSGGSTVSYTPITLLNYAAPDSRNFYPKYFGGVRMINRWPGLIGGPKHCTEALPCERGYVDFTVGQDTSVTGGIRQHIVLTVDSTYPLPVPNLNFLYLFGTFSKRVGDLPPQLLPLILQPGTSSSSSGSASLTSPNPAILVVPLSQPDRDFYRFGAGVNILKVFTALTGQSKSQ
jgi:hypothetical protein